jgi:small subunit ribosomal protein S20
MANTRSAAKQARKSSRLRLLNKKAGDELRQAAKKIKNLVKEGLKDEATALLKGYQSMVDKAAKKGRLKKNTAARRTGRIAKLVKTEVKPVEAKPKRAVAKKKTVKKAAPAAE